MPFISGEIAVREDPPRWELLESLVYQGKTQLFTAPVGYQTDFASVPRIFFWLFPSSGTYTRAAVLHDYLCDTAVVPRDEADGIFRRAMRELGVPFLRRWMMWAAVRAAARLKGASSAELAVWLLVAVPSVVFLFIPAVVITIWLALFWLIELVVYRALKIFAPETSTGKQVNPPKLNPSATVPGTDEGGSAGGRVRGPG